MCVYIKILFSVIFILIGGVKICTYASPGFPQDTGKVFQDDPIAAMLDSLVQINFFDQVSKPYSVKNSKYNFAPDSVPVYDVAIYEQRMAKIDAQSPFDLVYNDHVRQYVNMYANKRRLSVSKMLGLSEMYFPLFEEQLAKHNLPMELKYLPIIESALNPTAK